MGLTLNKVQHIALIASDYARSKHFYVDILGCQMIRESYREERQSYKLDLAIGGEYCIELFSFPDPPRRATRPEACGLRHLAFEVDDIEEAVGVLRKEGIEVEEIRVDEATEKRYTFFRDPDDLPLELYER